jgi:hypothetical protein
VEKDQKRRASTPRDPRTQSPTLRKLIFI